MSEDDPLTYSIGDVLRQRVKETSTAPLSEHVRLPGAPAIDDIADQLPRAAHAVWDKIMQEIDQQDVPARSPRFGVPGYEWQGSLNRVITQVWPQLPRPDYSTDPPTRPPQRTLIGQYLVRAQVLHQIKRGDRGTPALWWVAEEFVDVDPSIMQHTPSKTGNRMADRLSPAEAGENRVPSPVTITFRPPQLPPPRPSEEGEKGVKAEESRGAPSPSAVAAPTPTPTLNPPLYYCDQCSFTTVREHGLRVHIQRLGQKEHAQGRFPCPVGDCKEVRPDPSSLAAHITSRQGHHGLGLQVCWMCGGVFTSHAERVSHQVDSHPGAFTRKRSSQAQSERQAQPDEVTKEEPDDRPVDLPAKLPFMPTRRPREFFAQDETSIVPPLPARSSSMIVTSAQDGAQIIQGLLDELSDLRRRVPELQQQIESLTQRVEDLKKDNTRLREGIGVILEQMRKLQA